MQWLKWTVTAASITAMCSCFGNVMDDPENARAIIDYIETRRAVTVKDKEATLKIGGEVRVGHRYMKDKVGGQNLTGKRSGLGVPETSPTSGQLLTGSPGTPTSSFPPTPSTLFPLKSRLSLEYEKDETYAQSLLRFDNWGGIEDATYGDTFKGGRPFYDIFKPGNKGINLARAVYGYRFVDADGQKLALELGRRQMNDVFISAVQFNSNFDGALVRYENGDMGFGKLKVDAGAFVIDNRTYQFGHAVQVSALSPTTGLFANYSLINWYKDGQYADGTWGNVSKGGTGAVANQSYRFMNSQAIVGIALPEEMLGKMTKLSVGGLINHKARPAANSNYRKDNRAYFANLEYGDCGTVGQAGDWRVIASVQKVGAQAVQDSDARAGINGSGQTLAIPYFYPTNDGSLGFGNYKGVYLQGVYTLKEGVLLSLEGAYAVPNRKLGALRQGGKNSFSTIQTEVSYYF